MKIDIETLKKTKGIGSKTLERIIEQHYKDEGIKQFKSEYIPSEAYRVNEDTNLWNGDCLELMHHIPDKSIDMILCDLPYGTTACSWDTVIPFKPLWSHYKRIIKDNGVVVLFGSEPFSTKLRMSNLDWYKYDWIWDKKKGGNPLLSKIQPIKIHEDIMVFGEGRVYYNPIMELRDRPVSRGRNRGRISKTTNNSFSEDVVYTHKYPKSIIEFSNANQIDKVHPTQKPVELGEYLIKTYTNEGMTVMDNTMGVGSFGVSARKTNRKFIGIELDEEYFNIAKERIENRRND